MTTLVKAVLAVVLGAIGLNALAEKIDPSVAYAAEAHMSESAGSNGHGGG